MAACSAAVATCLSVRTRYQKQAFTVRNMRAVRKKASCGTRRIFRGVPCQKQPLLVRDASSKAHRTADSTDCGQPPVVRDAFSEACRAKSSLLPHRTHLQCAKKPPPSLFAPAAPSLAPPTALGTRNDPRSEVSRHKKRVTSKSIKTF